MHTTTPAAPPLDVFPTWRRAQLELDRHARESALSPYLLRTTGFLRPELAEWVTEWFTDAPEAPDGAVRRSYAALARESARLYEVVRHCLGVRVTIVSGDEDPYGGAAELCADLREFGSMTLACDEPHPLLAGAHDQLRVVHDVFGHAALGLGFDLQSEFATWLQCRTLFSSEARPAAFCELVGAVTAYITTGEKPGLQAKLPPAELLAACEI
jgi:hypothetical protein